MARYTRKELNEDVALIARLTIMDRFAEFAYRWPRVQIPVGEKGRG